MESGFVTPGNSTTIRSVPCVCTSGSETPVLLTRRSMKRLRDASAVDAALDDVADGGEIGSGGADAVNGLHLIFHAKSATKVEAKLGLNRTCAASCAACRKAEIWE